MDNCFIRPLVRDDLARVAYLVDANDMFPSELLDAMTAPFLDDESRMDRWLVFDREEVEGVAYCAPEPLTDGTWNLLLIAVDPVAHGKGIGTKLMHFVEAELTRDRVRVLLVETSGLPEFARTRGLYEGLGYEREARIRDYYAAGDDKVVFRKALR